MADQNTNVQRINQGRPVYFSYARNSNKKPEWSNISDCVEPLLQALDKEGIEYRVDVKDIGAGDKISAFEEEIGWKSEVVVIVFSDKYFRSMHCMYEFVQIKNAIQKYTDKRLICIKAGDFNLSDPNYIMELEDFWHDQKQEYEKIEFHRLRSHSGTEQAAWQNGFYLEDVILFSVQSTILITRMLITTVWFRILLSITKTPPNLYLLRSLLLYKNLRPNLLHRSHLRLRRLMLLP